MGKKLSGEPRVLIPGTLPGTPGRKSQQSAAFTCRAERRINAVFAKPVYNYSNRQKNVPIRLTSRRSQVRVLHCPPMLSAACNPA